jgi:VanZ family protein
MSHAIARLLHPRHQPWWRALLVLLVLVVAGFAFTPSMASLPIEHVDKVQHVLAFGCMAGVAALGWPAWRSTALKIGAALLTYGVFIEVVQSFIPGRDASALDVLADGLGVAAGLLAAQAVRLFAAPDTS